MFRVALSAGHGQKKQKGSIVRDPGAVNPRVLVNEHALCLRIQTLVRMLLQFTADIDLTLIPPTILEEKVKLINKGKFHLAVEVHLNSSSDRNVSGTEVLYFPGSSWGRLYAARFQEELLYQLQVPDRGIKERKDLYFLRATNCPAVITEGEFISNDEIARQLKEDFLTERIAFAHAAAIWKIAKGT